MKRLLVPYPFFPQAWCKVFQRELWLRGLCHTPVVRGCFRACQTASPPPLSQCSPAGCLMSHTPLPPGGPGPVDRKCGIDPGGPRPVLHAAEDPWRPDLESHHPAGFPLHLREQADGHHREGEWSPPLSLCLPLPLGVLPLPLSILSCPEEYASGILTPCWGLITVPQTSEGV